jgi:hypothetical protein
MDYDLLLQNKTPLPIKEAQKHQGEGSTGTPAIYL